MPEPAHSVAQSLRAFMEGIVDYAGMFPPARLSLAEAFTSYLRYRGEPDAWMLGRFVVPAGRLAELADSVRRLRGSAPASFSVIGSGADDTATFVETLAGDLEAMARFEEETAGGGETAAMEVRIPAGTAGIGELRSLVQGLEVTVERASPLDVFLELPIDDDFRQRLPALLQEISGQPNLAVKLRTGGAGPEDFPPAGVLAFALKACRDASVRFKATAGLHHPVRRYDPSVRTQMHGFVNLFGAAILGAEHELDEEILEEILLDEHAGSFRFADAGFAWKDLTAPPASVRRARRKYAVSFGSCSFDEPRDEVSEFGLRIWD